MNKAYDMIKKDLKIIMNEIKKMKSQRRSTQCGYVKGLNEKCEEFRCKHIAHCELKGRTREQIECPKDGNKANEYLVDKYSKQLTKLIKQHEENGDENVCINEK